MDASQSNGDFRWGQVLEGIGLAYIMGFLMLPVVVYTAVEYLTTFPVLSGQFSVIFIFVVASLILAAKVRSRLVKLALRTASFTLLPWSALFALSPHT
jgi:hypothetical protein